MRQVMAATSDWPPDKAPDVTITPGRFATAEDERLERSRGSVIVPVCDGPVWLGFWGTTVPSWAAS
jgi:hypothetical protein